MKNKMIFAAMVAICMGSGAFGMSAQPEAMELIMATKKGDEVRVKEILASDRVDVNAQDDAGNTALHAAVHGDNMRLTNILLEAGANPNAENAEGKSAKDMAADKGNNVMVEMMERQSVELPQQAPSMLP